MRVPRRGEIPRAIAPKPDETAFWLHLGANLASRGWHHAVGGIMLLPGTDFQRYLVVSPDLVSTATRAFAGVAGPEVPYASDKLSAGELTGIVSAGYPSVAVIFGIHRFHHVAGDDAAAFQRSMSSRGRARPGRTRQ